MALTQRQLAECAQEALQAQQAFDELRTGIQEALEQQGLDAEGRLVLIRYVLRDLPVPGTSKSEAALAHIRKTSARNERRALEALEARKRRSEK